MERAAKIQELWMRSDGGKAFQAALEDAGYTLSQGNRRAFAIVDKNGEIYSLSRQLKNDEGKGMRAKDLRERLSDIELDVLPQAKTLSEERMHFDRDTYEAEWQKQVVDAAIEKEESRANDDQREQKPKPKEKEAPQKPDIQKEPIYDDSHLRKLDAQREWEYSAEQKRYRLEEELAKAYKRNMASQRLNDLQAQLEKNDTFWGRLLGRYGKSKEAFDAQRRTLENIDWRMKEQRDALELEIQKSKPKELSQDAQNDPTPTKKQEPTITQNREPAPPSKAELTPEQEKEKLREQYRQQMKRNLEKGRGRDLGR